MAQPVAVFTDAPEEHLATRRSCGLFDFSFMGHFEIAGSGARALLDRLQTRNLASLAPGRIAYTLLLRPDGTVFIDATVWCLGPERYWLFTGRQSDFAFVAGAVRERAVVVRDLSGANAVLALQGPDSGRVLERHLGDRPGIAYFGFRDAAVGAVPVTVGRIGYSGELGYELIVPIDHVTAVRRRLAGDARECGFDAVNSLRIESGYILFTNELVQPVNPFELGFERLVSFDGRAFEGREALLALRWREPERRLVGFDAFTRRDPAGLPRAAVTSRVRSPTLGRELGLGFVRGAVAPGARVSLGDGEAALVCRLPFYDPGRMLPRKGD